MGSNCILFLVLFLIIIGQSCVLLLLIFRTRQGIYHLADELQYLRNETKYSKCEIGRLEDKTQQLTNEVGNLRRQLNDSDRKNEEDRKALKMLMISNLRNDIDTLDKRDNLDEELRVLLDQVKKNISETEDT